MLIFNLLNPLSWIYHFFVISVILIDIASVFILNAKKSKPDVIKDTQPFPSWNEIEIETEKETVITRVSNFMTNEVIMSILILNVSILFYEFILNIYTCVFVASAFIYFTRYEGLNHLFDIAKSLSNSLIQWLKTKILERILP